MPVRIVTADERLATANNKTSLAIFGPPGSGKTSLLRTLPSDKTVCLDLEAGMKSVQDWPGASIPIRSYTDFRDLAVLIGGPDPAADPNAWYSAQHHQHARGIYAGSGIEEFLTGKSIVFIDSGQRPEARLPPCPPFSPECDKRGHRKHRRHSQAKTGTTEPSYVPVQL